MHARQSCYVDAGLKSPQCWKEGLLKPNNHTISVSDVAFVAGFHGPLYDAIYRELPC